LPSRAYSAYMLLVAAAGHALLLWLSMKLGLSPAWQRVAASPTSLAVDAGFFLALSVVVGVQPVRLPGRAGADTTVGFAVDYACLVIFGPAVGAWIVVISDTVLLWRSNGLRRIFNNGMLILSFVGACGVYRALGGNYVFWERLLLDRPVAFKSLGLALIGSAVAYFTLSSLLISIAMALWERSSTLGLWVVSFRWVMPRSLALAPFGLLMAMAYQVPGLGIFAVFLFLVPLIGARFAFKSAMEMLDVHRQTVYALSNALEAYDVYTRNHSELVTRYALLIGRELGLSAPRLEVLEWAGRLHDIGKVRQDWEPIIRKPGRPSEQEWRVIRQHPVEGSRLAEKMEFLPHTAGKVASIVRAHHERLDGSGYPDGSEGQAIPLEARILGVADAFEAMTAKRAYHRQRPLEEAIAELRRCAGSQFDPQVVETLAALWERGELRMEEPSEQSPLLPTPIGGSEEAP